MKGGTSGTGDGRSPQAEYSAQPPEAALSARANAGRPAGRDSNDLVYIASPYAGDVARNVAFAKAACRYALERGQTPVAVHLLYPQLLRDSDPTEREARLQMGERVLAVCGELWVCGSHISEGMAREIAEAERLGIPIREVSAQEIEGGILIEQQDFITEKLYSPVFCKLEDVENIENYDGDYWRDEISQKAAAPYRADASTALQKLQGDLDTERGLMAYFDEDMAVESKARSLFVDVEVREERLWGVATITLTEPLNHRELAVLKDYVEGQYADGLGESFEQRPVKTGDGDLYVSLWENDKTYFIATEHEFCDRFGLTPPSVTVSLEPKEQLMERLTANLAGYHADLLTLSKQEIISKANKIAPVNDAHYFLTEHHEFDAAETAFLLRFENPLKVVADRWQAEGEGEDAMARIMKDQRWILEKLDYTLEKQEAGTVLPRISPDKPSVLAQLREAKAAPTPTIPLHKKSEPER